METQSGSETESEYFDDSDDDVKPLSNARASRDHAEVPHASLTGPSSRVSSDQASSLGHRRNNSPQRAMLQDASVSTPSSSCTSSLLVCGRASCFFESLQIKSEPLPLEPTNSKICHDRHTVLGAVDSSACVCSRQLLPSSALLDPFVVDNKTSERCVECGVAPAAGRHATKADRPHKKPHFVAHDHNDDDTTVLLRHMKKAIDLHDARICLDDEVADHHESERPIAHHRHELEKEKEKWDRAQLEAKKKHRVITKTNGAGFSVTNDRELCEQWTEIQNHRASLSAQCLTYYTHVIKELTATPAATSTVPPCGHYSQDIQLQPPASPSHENDAESALCDCCRCIVPANTIVQADTQVARRICRMCYDGIRDDPVDTGTSSSSVSPLRPTPSWINRLTGAQARLQTMLQTVADGERDQISDGHRRVVAWKQLCQSLKVLQRKVLQCGIDSPMLLALRRLLYDEQVAMDAIGCSVLMHHIRVLFGVAARQQVTLPAFFKAIAEPMYQDELRPLQFESAKKQTTKKKNKDENSKLPTPRCCRNCTAVLARPSAADGDDGAEDGDRKDEEAGYCDCCLRMLPQCWVSASSPAARVTLCSGCREGAPKDGKKITTNRMDPKRVDELVDLTSSLKELLSLKAEGESVSLQEAQGQVRKQRGRVRNLSTRQRKVLRRGDPTLHTSRGLYSEHVEKTAAYFEALTTLARLQLDALHEQGIDLPAELCDMAAFSKREKEAEKTRMLSATNPGKDTPGHGTDRRQSKPVLKLPLVLSATVSTQRAPRCYVLRCCRITGGPCSSRARLPVLLRIASFVFFSRRLGSIATASLPAASAIFNMTCKWLACTEMCLRDFGLRDAQSSTQCKRKTLFTGLTSQPLGDCVLPLAVAHESLVCRVELHGQRVGQVATASVFFILGSDFIMDWSAFKASHTALTHCASVRCVRRENEAPWSWTLASAKREGGTVHWQQSQDTSCSRQFTASGPRRPTSSALQHSHTIEFVVAFVSASMPNRLSYWVRVVSISIRLPVAFAVWRSAGWWHDHSVFFFGTAMCVRARPAAR